MRAVMGIVAGVLLCFSGAAEATSISTRWGNTQMAQNECLEHAARAIREAGFDALTPTETSRYGTRGDYVIAVRCLTQMKMYFMSAAGPSDKETAKYVEEVDHGF
ncbi:MAG TPA: hypothetical protein VKX28_29440 [Xanthobacteraceae bacterium]|nr:hypothetical protein [Xanthobacteraceae bacterium]